MKIFLNIVIQEKSKGDYRSFCHCIDSDGNHWELRGYGKTVSCAANDAWLTFNLPESQWEIHGYITGA